MLHNVLVINMFAFIAHDVTGMEKNTEIIIVDIILAWMCVGGCMGRG